MDEENLRAWVELFENRLEKVEQIIYGIPPLKVPGILERIEAAEKRARRAIWILALCMSTLWLLTTITIFLFVASHIRGG